MIHNNELHTDPINLITTLVTEMLYLLLTHYKVTDKEPFVRAGSVSTTQWVRQHN